MLISFQIRCGKKIHQQTGYVWHVGLESAAFKTFNTGESCIFITADEETWMTNGDGVCKHPITDYCKGSQQFEILLHMWRKAFYNSHGSILCWVTMETWPEGQIWTWGIQWTWKYNLTSCRVPQMTHRMEHKTQIVTGITSSYCGKLNVLYIHLHMCEVIGSTSL